MSIKLNQTRNHYDLIAQSSKDSLAQYILCVGPGRSGTTWLGQMMNQYEHCSYKYEPFLESKATPYRDWKHDLESGDVEQLRQSFLSLCNSCYLEVDQPPFPPKSFRHQNPQLLHLLYGLGQRNSVLKQLYQWYGKNTFSSQNSILIKDVNFPNKLLPNLCQVLQPHLIAIIRNPFANIASYLKGIELGLFDSQTSEKIDRIRQHILNEPACEHLSHYIPQLEKMSGFQLEALRWRIQVEPLVDYAKNYNRGFVVVYEDLCLDPHGKIREIFDFVNWEIPQATKDFIDKSISGEKASLGKGKSYHSVYRDPRQSISKWKKQLSREQQKEIATVIRESPLKNLWSDLPL